MPSAEAQFDRVAPWVVGGALAGPVVAVRFPPMRDLPLHEAVVGVLRHFGDRSYFPAGLYTLNLGHPNQAFYLAAWLLSYVVSVPLACKLVAAAPVALFPAAVARFARHLGRPGWIGVLASPVMLGWLFFWGVVANMIGLVVLFATLPTLDRAASGGTWGGCAKVAGILALFYLAHEEVLLVGCAFVVLVALTSPVPRSTRALWPVVAVAFGVAIELVAVLVSRSPLNAKGPLAFASLGHKASIVTGMLFPGQGPWVRAGADALVAVPIVWLFVLRLRIPGGKGEPLPRKARIYERRFSVFLAVLFAGYVLFPDNFLGAHLLYHRFLPPAFALALVLLAPPREAAKLPGSLEEDRPDVLPRYPHGSLPWIALAAPLASLCVTGPTMMQSDALYRDFEWLLSGVERGSAIAVIDTEDRPGDLLRGRELQGHAVALAGGRSFFDYTQSPIAPAVLAAGSRWNESTERLLRNGFRPAWDLRHYRYVFLHVRDLDWFIRARSALAPEGRFVDGRGEWLLFESTLPLVPLTAPDEAPPSPPPDTFLERARDRRTDW
ncbi:MAG TPA: hypothetical protein VGI39_30695 [Polyangiaceae bacterium]|jgi:hypothetical protein